MSKNATTLRNERTIARLEAFGGLRDQSMGDERESQVLLRGNSIALTFGLLTQFALAIGLALTGYWIIAFIVVILAGLQGYVSMWYTTACGVSNAALNQRMGRRRKLATWGLAGLVILGFIGARMYQLFTGHALIRVDGVADIPTSPSTAWGMLVGALLGVGAAVVGFVVDARKAKARELQDIDEN